MIHNTTSAIVVKIIKTSSLSLSFMFSPRDIFCTRNDFQSRPNEAALVFLILRKLDYQYANNRKGLFSFCLNSFLLSCLGFSRMGRILLSSKLDRAPVHFRNLLFCKFLLLEKICFASKLNL